MMRQVDWLNKSIVLHTKKWHTRVCHFFLSHSIIAGFNG